MYLYTRETPAFGGISVALRGAAPSAAIKEEKRKEQFWGAGDAPIGAAAYAYFGSNNKKGDTCGAPNDFKDLTRAMRIPNMCLVLKLDNGKVVSIANEQNHRAIQYRISI